VILRRALADFEGSAALTAVTFTVLDDGTVLGALYRPVYPMFPTMLLPPATPLTFHDSALLELFWTVAVNCLLLPARTVALAGLTLICTEFCSAWPESGLTISVETSTASQPEPAMVVNARRSVLSQRASGAPENVPGGAVIGQHHAIVVERRQNDLVRQQETGNVEGGFQHLTALRCHALNRKLGFWGRAGLVVVDPGAS
jgi:hypothetical protein